MAEGFLKSFDKDMEVYSAGTNAESIVNPYAVKVMTEKAMPTGRQGIDISKQIPKNVDLFLKENFDYVITVCDDAKETCPVFTGNVKHRLHINFEDPATATGSDEEKLAVYRKVRDQIEKEFRNFVSKLKS